MLYGQWVLGGGARIFCRCPDLKCQETFIAYYDKKGGPISNQIYWEYRFVRPVTSLNQNFDEPIPNMSESFCAIYNEAKSAEELGLLQICGVGYRKSIEFLIKDYLISNNKADAKTIKATPLGACIANYVSDANIKAVAARATWLGNDETHYERKWIGKDLGDLKRMIDLVVHWIRVEFLTKSALESMPNTL
jgi:hypothetical protein